jgi:hypothetical protein
MTSKWPEWHPQTLDNSHAHSLVMDGWILKPLSIILCRPSSGSVTLLALWVVAG